MNISISAKLINPFIYPLIFIVCILTLLTGQIRDWTIVATYPIPEGASGLAFDGVYLYCGIYGANGNEVYQIDPTDGSYQLLFTNPVIEDCFGMTYDGNHLWITDHPGSSSIPAVAYKLDMSGNIVSQMNLPDHYMSGIAYDNGNFWVATYYDPNGHIYKVNSLGYILQDFPAPDNQPWDLSMEYENLWMADYWGDALYYINTDDGSLIDSYASEGVDPAGIVFDGTYLWYCDNGQDYQQDFLYKVDLGGAGTPGLELGFDEYNFGQIIVGEQSMVELQVTNIGTANLELYSVEFSIPQYSTTFQPPLILLPNQSSFLSIVFEPDSFGEYSAIMTISSSDPINPNEEVSLNGFGIFQEQNIVVTPTSISFGNIRVGAVTGEFVEILNQGEENLIIDTIQFDTESFYYGIEVEFPIIMSTNDIYYLRVWFSSDLEMEFAGTMSIFSNDPDENIVVVSLSGTGEEMAFPIGQIIWQFQINTSSDNSPKAIIPISDISGDGIDDVIISSEDGYVRCFNGNSSGTADVLWEIEIGSVHSQLGLTMIDDINNDDFMDIIIGAAWGDRSIHALSGLTGEIIWTHDTHEYGGGGWVYQVHVKYDYNDDEIPDVLAATGNDQDYTGPQRIYCLDGLTGNSIWEFYTPGSKYSVIGIEDSNGDGIPDVVGGGSNLDETQGIVYGINGDNGNELWSFNVSGSTVWALEQTDHLNWNGVKEIIAGDFSGNYYCLEPADGSEIWNGNIGNSIILRFIKLDDVNNDNFPDLYFAHSGFHNALVVDGHSGSQIWNQPVADQPWNAARIDDISGDGINDLLVGTMFNSNYGYYLNGVDGSEIGSVNVGTPVDAIAAIPDITGDGSMEMVVGGRNGWVYCYSGGNEFVNEEDFEVINLMNWNMVGLPLEVEDASYNTLFPNAIENTLYSFDGGYIPQTILVPGAGYWLRFESVDSTTITGTPINELTISLSADWNLISGISAELSIYAVLDSDSIIVPNTIYGFSEGYTMSEIFSPGNGYWIRAYEAGEISLISGTSAKTAPREFSLKDIANSLNINGTDLYFGIELSDRERLSYSLPPKPPTGAFDVRFKGNTRVAGGISEIEVMSPDECLTISYNIILDVGQHLNWVITSENGKEYTLEGTGEITVPKEETFTLERKMIFVPNNYALHQNYPNPFNPITSLRYGLPEAALVTLTIYDLMGREVTQLVNTIQEAGYRLVQWNATDSFGKPVSAGVYLYQIRAGEFVQTRKMVLLK